MKSGTSLSMGALVGAAALLSLAGSASAITACGVGTICDGTFTTPSGGSSYITYGAGTSAGTSMGPWSVNSGTVDLIGGYWMPPSPGTGSVDLDGNNPGAISQVVTTTLGQMYELSFYLSGNPDGGPSTKTVNVTVGASDPPYTYTVTLLNSKTSMDYAFEDLFFTGLGGATLISFASGDDASSPYGPVIGDVVLAATPLPQTFALISGGLGLVGFMARRKRKSRASSRLDLAA
jgi:choice-of-anchor C domain-containing protein